MAGRPRKFDPDLIVHQSVARRLGVRTQAETEREARFARRLDTVGEALEVIPGPLEVMGQFVFHGGRLVWPLVSSTDVEPFEIALEDPGVAEDILWIGRDPATGNFVAEWWDNSPQVMLKLNHTTGQITIGGSQSLLIGYDPVGLVTTYTLDNRTGDIATVGKVRSQGNEWSWRSGAHADASAATLSVVGMPAWTPAGTVTVANSSAGPFLNYATTAVLNNVAGLVGPAVYRRDWGFDVEFHVNVVDTTLLRLWVGLADVNPSAADTPVTNIAAFRYSTAVPDVNWQCRRGDGAAGGTADSGVAVSAGGYHLRIVGNATSVQWYIGGVLVADRNTNIPTATTLLAPYVEVTTLSAAIRNFRFSKMNMVSQ